MHRHGTQIIINSFLTFSKNSQYFLPSHRDIGLHGQQPISHVCETERVNVLTNEFKLASDWLEVERWGGRAPLQWGRGVTGETLERLGGCS